MIERISGSLLDPQSLYIRDDALFSSTELRGLNLVMGFTGFADAGHVVRQITAELLDTLDAEMIAEFDADQLIDYRSRRPQVSFVEDHLQDYQAPSLALYRLVDGLGSPFLLLAGFEPDLQWERFARAVVGLVEELDVNLVTWIHSIPMPVPHTRPVGVTVHGNRPELIEGISVWKPTVEVPAAVGHILELRLTEAGRNIAGYVIHVPHYLAEAEYPTAAVAGLEYLGAATSLMLPTDRLREAGREVGRQIAEQIEASEEVQQVVSRLETRYDEKAEGTVRRSLLADENDQLPNADALGAAVEAYLARKEPGE
ncbi:Predicted ATP-dependent carboligase, ATP-grasp superfamily [Arthrobacter sp. 49Tsu3.1M3]|uniref:proteasome assembly chaperone family protein n=1 Tax=Arthrobacter TaxID=1663 RepID=UPI0009A90806|nr:MULTISPECIES: PAC2 family protein [Arthrobacter]MCI9870666.1 PAC2 family protein [Arthrobacter humicola]SKB85295.1 Predicted ATP-dependent carboligase, ATP-grasp superfamily [Arthrobacter sp. 49Tsu3.1M3]